MADALTFLPPNSDPVMKLFSTGTVLGRSAFDGTRSRVEDDKRIEKSKLWPRLASAVVWLAGEAKPPGVKWLSY